MIPDHIKNMTSAQMRAEAERHRRNGQELIEKHGHGVRPSYVSADLEDAYNNYRKWREWAKEKEAQEVEKDGFITVHPEVKR